MPQPPPIKQESQEAVRAADDTATKAAHTKYIRTLDGASPAARTRKVPPDIGLKIKEGGPQSVKICFEKYINGGCDWAAVFINIKASYKSWPKTNKKTSWKTKAQLLEFYKDHVVVASVKAAKKDQGQWKPNPDAPSCKQAILYTVTKKDSMTEGTRNNPKQTVTMTATINHVVAQSLLGLFQQVTMLAPGGVLKDGDADQRSHLEAEKQKKKEAADAARLAKRELATNKAEAFKSKMARDLGTCEVCLRELEAASVNKDTKKDYTKRFLKHRQGLVKIGEKINTTVARDDNKVCRSLLKEAEAQVLALKDSWRAWKKVKQAALL